MNVMVSPETNRSRQRYRGFLRKSDPPARRLPGGKRRHTDLYVRITGFSEQFAHLHPDGQEDVLARTQHTKETL